MRFAKAAALAAVGLTVAIAGCSAHHPAAPRAASSPHRPEAPASAVLTGYVVPCSGVLHIGDRPVRVRVIVRHSGRVVATDIVRYSPDRDRYRIAVPPGSYTISASRSADPARTVSLTAGQVRTVNFPDYCI